MRRVRDQGIKRTQGPGDQGTRGPRGPEDQGTRGPGEDQGRTRGGPGEDQGRTRGTRGTLNYFSSKIIFFQCLRFFSRKLSFFSSIIPFIDFEEWLMPFLVANSSVHSHFRKKNYWSFLHVWLKISRHTSPAHRLLRPRPRAIAGPGAGQIRIAFTY